MVLHLHQWEMLALGSLNRVARRQVVRVQVAGDPLRRYPEQPLEVLDALLERAQRLIVLQVANMLAQEGVLLPR